MPKGNPNPSPRTRFKPGQVGNPGGKPSEQRQAEIRNAWIATDARTKFLERLNARLDDPAVVDAILDRININALLKDAEDRGLGAPKASVDLTNSDGSLKSRQEDAVLEALSQIHGKPPAT